MSQGFDLDQFYTSEKIISNLGKSSLDKIDSLYDDYIDWQNISPDQKNIREFVFEYNYFLEQLNKSGRVFYENEINTYLNDLKNEILAKDKSRDRIQVFTVNSSDLNAFTNDFGAIYVNIGTLAKVRSETELLVILAHEISHVLLRHSYKIEDLNRRFEENQFDGINNLDTYERHNYSRQHELEADKMAYDLLQAMGVDLSVASDIFDRLQFNSNPVFEFPIYLNEGWGVSSNKKPLLLALEAFSQSSTLISKIKSDSITTHPSVEQRRNLYFETILSVEDSRRESSPSFQHCRHLASMVLLGTYATDHMYIEGLYLAMQLQQLYPNDPIVAKSKLKFLMLLTQNNYEQDVEVINNYGSSCNDTAFMQYRHSLLHISPLELNIITYQTICDYATESTDPYVARLKEISLQFFYRYNPNLFEADGSGVKIKNNFIYNKISYAFAPYKLFTESEKERAIELRKEGYLLVEKRIGSEQLVTDFIQNFNDIETLNTARANYKNRRDSFEKMLTLDQFLLDFDSQKSNQPYKKGKHLAFGKISQDARIGLIQSDTYVSKLNKYENTWSIDYEKTLKLEHEIAEILSEELLFDAYLSNRFVENRTLSISDNYQHHLLSSWISETMTFRDLVYSVTDEEFSTYMKNDSLDYIVYNMNFIGKGKGGYMNLFYDIYFDVESMGIAYVSCVTSRKKPSRNYLRHYYYQSLNGIRLKK